MKKYKVKLAYFPLTWEVVAEDEKEAEAKGWAAIFADMSKESVEAGGFIEIAELAKIEALPVYTSAKWGEDTTFKAAEGQEIEAGIYNTMLDCLPPYDLPTETAQQAERAFNIKIAAGFLVGEPYSSDGNGRQLYGAFCKTVAGRYYYLGLSYLHNRIKASAE